MSLADYNSKYVGYQADLYEIALEIMCNASFTLSRVVTNENKLHVALNERLHNIKCNHFEAALL